MNVLTNAPTNRVRHTVIQIGRHVDQSSTNDTKEFPNGS
jgi:hypothetical protein